MKTITAKARFWATSAENFNQLFTETDPEVIKNLIHLYNSDMTSLGWVDLGEGSMSLDLPKKQEALTKAADALEQQMASVRAKAHKEVMELQEKLNNLLALSYAPSEQVDYLHEREMYNSENTATEQEAKTWEEAQDAAIQADTVDFRELSNLSLRSGEPLTPFLRDQKPDPDDDYPF